MTTTKMTKNCNLLKKKDISEKFFAYLFFFTIKIFLLNIITIAFLSNLYPKKHIY